MMMEDGETLRSKLVSFLGCFDSSTKRNNRTKGTQQANRVENIEALLDEQKKLEWGAAKEVHERYAARNDLPTLSAYSPINDFHRNLESYLGPPKKLLYEAMENEHCNCDDSDLYFTAYNYGIRTTSKIEWNYVVDPTENGLQKVGLTEWPAEEFCEESKRRKIKLLDDFEESLGTCYFYFVLKNVTLFYR